MFKFDKAEYPLTLEEVQSKVSEYDIFRRYCSNFKSLNQDFLSEFYNDTRPSCRIYKNNKGNLIYKDFGNGDNLNCYSYIMKKYYCTFHESLNIIANDFEIKKMKVDIRPNIIVSNDTILNDNEEHYKSRIKIVSQPYNIVDSNIWKKWKIPLSLLEEYNVFSCSHVYLYKKDKVVTFESKPDNPIYAYRFCNDGVYNYKIYKPLEPNKRYKWLFSGRANDIEGYDQLPWLGDILILTKSLKDCMCYNLIGYPAISLQGEANRFEQELKNRLLKRFKTIIINYDNDVGGKRGASRIMRETGFKSFIIDDYKDLSDYLVDHTIEEAKIMIDKKINEINQ